MRPRCAKSIVAASRHLAQEGAPRATPGSNGVVIRKFTETDIPGPENGLNKLYRGDSDADRSPARAYCVAATRPIQPKSPRTQMGDRGGTRGGGEPRIPTQARKSTRGTASRARSRSSSGSTPRSPTDARPKPQRPRHARSTLGAIHGQGTGPRCRARNFGAIRARRAPPAVIPAKAVFIAHM